MKILSIIGTRPQFVKIFPINRAIQNYKKNGVSSIEHIILNTGQHFDTNMSGIFIKEMDIGLPKYNLDIREESQCSQISKMILGLEKILLSEEPNMVLVYGDTNSTLAGAIATKKLNFTLSHVEAGLRSYKNKMQEEINRVMVDKISDILFCPTENAYKNLKNEGFVQNSNHKVFVVGDVMYDCFLKLRQTAISQSKILGNIFKEKIPGYIIATIHRAENTDNQDRLKQILKIFKNISKNKVIIFPIHPRTKKEIGIKELEKINSDRIKIIDPVSYFDMLKLINGSDFVITDSGGLQKEAYFSKKVCITLREETEWVETLDNNCNYLVDLNYNIINTIINKNKKPIFKNDIFGQGNASKNIIKVISESF